MSRINAPLVFVNGNALPQPSGYTSNQATLVDAARNAQGHQIGTPIRSDVQKIELTWNYLSREDWEAVCGPFRLNFVNTVTFFNTTSGDFEPRQMYISDRTATVHLLDRISGLPRGYTNCRIALIEV